MKEPFNLTYHYILDYLAKREVKIKEHEDKIREQRAIMLAEERRVKSDGIAIFLTRLRHQYILNLIIMSDINVSVKPFL